LIVLDALTGHGPLIYTEGWSLSHWKTNSYWNHHDF